MEKEKKTTARVSSEECDAECLARARAYETAPKIPPMTRTDVYLAVGIVVVCIVMILIAYFVVYPKYVP